MSEQVFDLAAATGTLQVATSSHGRVTVVSIKDPRLEARNAFACRNFLRDQVAAGSTHIVVDLSRVSFMDSSGLGAIVAGMKALAAIEHLALAAPAFEIVALLKLTRMNVVIRTFPTVREAVEALS